MKKARNSKLLKLISAVSMTFCMLSDGIFTVAASAQTTGDYTGDQWYFYENQNGVAFPDWNAKAGEGVYKQNVDSNKKAVIAVVDSGIDYSHEDLTGVMWKKSGSGADTKLTELGFGEYGIDTLNGDNDPKDESGHGTHVAGIIAAQWNGFGISGALNGVKLMAVRATGADISFVVKGLEKVLAAKQAGVNIVAVNLSWNGNAANSAPELMDDIITRLGEAGIVTVMAAGNGGADLNQDEYLTISSFLRSNPYVISVSGTDKDGNISDNVEGLESNYGNRYCSVAAPGVDILSTYKTPAAGQNSDTPEEQNGIETLEEGRYAKMSGTSMAAPIVTALAALVYDRNSSVDAGGNVTVDLDADEIAARVIESANLTEALKGKVYGGMVKPSAAVGSSIAPLPYYGRYKSGSLTIWGTDFGTSQGSVVLDDKSAAVTAWSDGSITLSTGALSLGEHSVTINRADHKSATRWIDVTGSTSVITELSTDGLEGITITGMTYTNGNLYVTGMDMSDVPVKPVLLSRAPGASKWNVMSLGEVAIGDMDGGNGRLYFLTSNSILVFNPSNGNIEQTIPVSVPENYGTKIGVLGDRIILGYVVNEQTEHQIHIATVNSDGSLTEIAASEGRDRILGFFSQDGVKMMITEEKNADDTEDTIAVYKINEADKSTAKIFEKKYGVSVSSLRAFGYKDRLVIGPIVTHDSSDSYSFAMAEYELGTGKQLQNVILGGGHLKVTHGDGYMFYGAIGEGMFYSAFLADASRHNTGALMVPLNGYIPPTPKPTPAPTVQPTAAPGGGSGEPVKPAVQTCQDVGYPSDWYWDESKKACVGPSGEKSGTSGKYSRRGNGTYIVTPAPGSTTTATPGTGTGGDGENPEASASPEETLSPDPSASTTPETVMTETPEATGKPGLPIDIVNTKGLMYFLGIPIVMIIAGLAMYLLKNTALIPWIIGADAIITLILAILDHSLVGWILLVLNLAAVGLMALYRMGRSSEEPF